MMSDKQNHNGNYRFGAFELRSQPATLTSDGKTVALPSQPLRLLIELVKRRGDLLTHEDIHSLLWPDQNVDVTGRIHASIRQIRRALDDDNGAPKFIETVPRMGYRFVGDVVPSLPQQTGMPKGRVAIVAAAAVVAISGWWLASDRVPEQAETTAANSLDHFLGGRELLQASAYSEAAERLAQSVAANPEFAPAHAALAEAEYQLGEYASARELAERAISLDATYARGYLQRGLLLGWVERDWPAAEADLERALELTPEAPDVRLALAELYLLTGRQEESVAATGLLEQSELPSARMLAMAGRLYRLQRRHDEAESLCEKAVAKSPDLVAGQECLYRIALVRRDSSAARSIVPALATALGANSDEVDSFRATDAVDELIAFERWRLEQDSSAGTDTRPVSAAYAHIVLQQYDSALYLLQQASELRSHQLPAALHDLVFVGLFHQSAYGELCESVGVSPP